MTIAIVKCIVPILLSLLSIIEKDKNPKIMWVHVLNTKCTKKRLIKCCLCELRNDELKLKTFTQAISETFVYI